MKRFILVLLLLFAVPLQISWAAVSGYCEYEKAGAPAHFGHHEHHEDHGSGKGSLTKVHHDCSHHAGALAVVADSAGLLPAPAAGNVPPRSSTPPLSPLPDRPERPKWAAASL